MKRATTLIACCLVAGALLAGCGRKAAPVEAETKAGAPDRLVQVRGAAVTETVADETIAVTGSIEASTDVSIASKVPGRVVAIGAQEGERVPAGRVLVRLDDAAARGGVTQAEAGLRSARAQLEKASLSLSLVETQADSGVRTAEAALAAARARQESARSALAMTQTKSGDGGVDVGQAQAGLRVAEGQLRQAQQALLIARTKSTGDVETAEAAVEQATVGLTAAHNRANQAETTLTLTEQSTLSSITTAQQAVNQAQQQVAMLQTGARTQERGQSASALVAAQANLRTAQADYDRAKMLFDGGAVARATMDAAELRLDSAREQAKQAELADSLVIEGPRVEQVAIAQAQLASAQDQLNLAQTSRESTLSLRRDDLANAREGVTQAEAQLRQAQAAASTARAARAQVPIAEADVANAEQGVESARQALRLAESGVSQADIARHEVTAASQAVAQAEQGLRNARAGRVQPNLTRQDIAQLRGAVLAAEGTLAVARASLADHVIRAPIAGGIADKQVEVGNVVSPGLRLYRLVSDDFVNFKALVPEEKLRFVSVGDAVQVKVDALPDRVYEGRVLEILPAADERSRSFTVKVGIANPGGRLKQGMFARGSIVVQRDKRTLSVPVNALTRRDDRNWVVKLEGTRAVPTEVVLGSTVAGMVEIVEGNLSAQDTIVVDGAAEITSEQQVEVRANNDPRTNGNGSANGEAAPAATD